MAPIARFARFELPPGPPLPCEAGEPPAAAWAASGLPPCGYRFFGARRTLVAWLLRCPACDVGWVALVPDHRDPDGYRIALEIGCTGGCRDQAALLWWWMWRRDELPPPEPVEADEACHRYLAAAVRHATRRLLAAADPAIWLRREAFELGALAASRGVDPIAVARALAVAARHAGVPPEAAVAAIAANLLAGTARPRRATP